MTKKEKTTTEKCDEKDKALEIGIESLEKEYGKGIIISGNTKFNPIKRIPSGSVELDRALNGGYPRGRIVEIMGPESSGKTTLALHAIAEAQKMGLKCAFVDTEHALDPIYADALGIDVEELLISQPENGEQALNVVDTLVRTRAVGLIVVDSVAALVPQAELEKNIGDSSVGRQAALMSQAMRMLAGPVSRAESTVIFTNQIRMKIGVMFGSPETTSGGNALKFYASQRLDVRRIEVLKEGTGEDADKIGVRTRVKVIKNKVGPPYKEVQFNILFGKGIDKASELLDLAVDANIIEKSGAWFIYKEEKIQGASNIIVWLNNHPEVISELKSKLLEPKLDDSKTLLSVQ